MAVGGALAWGTGFLSDTLTYLSQGEKPVDTQDTFVFKRYQKFAWKYRHLRKVKCDRDCLSIEQIRFDPPLDYPTEGWINGQ